MHLAPQRVAAGTGEIENRELLQRQVSLGKLSQRGCGLGDVEHSCRLGHFAILEMGIP